MLVVPSPTPAGCIRVVAAAWLRDGMLLAGLRPANKVLGGHWEFPGGKVEAGETDKAALVREIREELGADVAVGDCFGEVVRGQIHLLAFVVSGASEPIALEHEALSWVEPLDWNSLGWAPADLVLIEALRAFRNKEGRAC